MQKSLIIKTVSLEKPCPSCSSKQGYITPSGNKIHLAKLSCISCNRFLKWLGKADYNRAIASDSVNFL